MLRFRETFSMPEEAEGGVGGLAGRKKDGTHTTVAYTTVNSDHCARKRCRHTMMAMYSTELGTSLAFVAHKGLMSWPSWIKC